MSAADRPALAVAERPRSLVQLMARKEKANALAVAIKAAFGLDLPPPGRWAAGAQADATWVQPGGWLLESEPSAPGAFTRPSRRRDGGPRRSGRSEQRPQRDPFRWRAGPVSARDLLPSRPPSARLQAGLGGDDADRACRLRNPSRRRDAHLRPHHRLDLCTLADRGASRSLRWSWRPVRTGAEALSLRYAGLRTYVIRRISPIALSASRPARFIPATIRWRIEAPWRRRST